MWDDSEAEYQVLIELVVPLAQADYERAVHDWSALDAKAFGFLAVGAAVIAGLATTHEGLNSRWWLPAIGCAVSGGFLIAATWLRELDLGPDPIDFHDEVRYAGAVGAAREMVEALTTATENVDEGYGVKRSYFSVGLVLLIVSLLGCLPIVVFRP